MFFADGDPGSLVNVAGIGQLASSDQPEARSRSSTTSSATEAQRYFSESTYEFPLDRGHRRRSAPAGAEQHRGPGRRPLGTGRPAGHGRAAARSRRHRLVGRPAALRSGHDHHRQRPTPRARRAVDADETRPPWPLLAGGRGGRGCSALVPLVYLLVRALDGGTTRSRRCCGHGPLELDRLHAGAGAGGHRRCRRHGRASGLAHRPH